MIKKKYSFADLHWLDNKLYLEGVDTGYSIWKYDGAFGIEKDGKFVDSGYNYGEAKDEAKKLAVKELNG